MWPKLTTRRRRRGTRERREFFESGETGKFSWAWLVSIYANYLPEDKPFLVQRPVFCQDCDSAGTFIYHASGFLPLRISSRILLGDVDYFPRQILFFYDSIRRIPLLGTLFALATSLLLIHLKKGCRWNSHLRLESWEVSLAKLKHRGVAAWTASAKEATAPRVEGRPHPTLTSREIF